MQKFIPTFLVLLSLLCLPPSLYGSDSIIDLGLNLGAWTPIDSKTTETFDSDFYMQGHLGMYDPVSHWGIRGNWGRYNANSHHPEDIGKGMELTVVPLTLSVIYQAGDFKNGVLQPYFGGGAGAYFYKVRDDIYGDLEDGTRFGVHAVAGLRMPFSYNWFAQIEYNYHLIPKIFFDNASHFNSHVVTFGIGYSFSTDDGGGSSSSYQSAASQSRSREEGVTYDSLEQQAQTLREEIRDMKAKRKEMEASIELFYTQSSFYTSTSVLKALDQKQQLVGAKLVVLNEGQSKPLIEGDITFVETRGERTVFTLASGQWTSQVTLQKRPFAVLIGTQSVTGITAANVDQLLRVDLITDSATFAQESRKITFYQERVKHLEKNIKEAQAELNNLNQLLESRRTQRRQDEREGRTTIIQYQDTGYRYRSPAFQYGYRNYYYYDPTYYNPPIFINTPNTGGGSVSPQDRQEFLERKQEYIRDVKSR